jgi:hypothetical protein
LGAVFIVISLADDGRSSIFVLEIEFPVEAGGTPCQAPMDMSIETPKIYKVNEDFDERSEGKCKIATYFYFSPQQ